MQNKKEDKASLAIGGFTLVGIGVGFIFIIKSIFLFIASILVGIGVGLVIASLIPNKK